MKTLLIYVSIHHGNTEKIARSMAEVLNAKLAKPNEVNVDELFKYDLLGFGSGIYFGQHHKSLLKLVDKFSDLKGKKAFIFSTRGVGNTGDFTRNIRLHVPLRKKLIKKSLNIIGEFSCKGFDTVGPFKLIGGINKGRPNEKDLQKAKDFAEELKNKEK